MRYMITDGVWEAMEPLVRQAQRHKGGQPPVLPERMFFEAVLYILRFARSSRRFGESACDVLIQVGW